jgi:protein CpxP
MKNSILKTTGPALLTLAFLTTSAWAQSTAASGTAATTSSAQREANHEKKHADYVEQRINDMHAQLKITDQQSQQWDAYAQTMRDNAHSTDQAFRDRAQKLPSMSADEVMKSYAALAQMHADNMQKLATAFSALYGTLSDDQKKIADTLFRNEHGKRHAGHAAPHKHKSAAPSGNAAAPAPASN